MPGRARSRRWRWLLVGLLPLLAGCGAARQSWRAGPAGLAAERTLRAQLASGDAAGLLASLARKELAPADALLRDLYRGMGALEAGDAPSAQRALDRAWQLAADRWTKQLRNAAASIMTGDGALPYVPGPAETALIPYYGALAALARDDRDALGVEARRLSAVLAGSRGTAPGGDAHAVLRLAAGAFFAAAGEWNDAEVARRNAAARLGARVAIDTLRPGADVGEVVVLVEEGFVVRPEPQGFVFWLDEREARVLGEAPGPRQDATLAVVRARQGTGTNWAGAGLRALSLRWPTMDLAGHRAITAPLTVAVDSGTAPDLVPHVLSASLSQAVDADFARAQPPRLARAIARAAMREALWQGAESAVRRAGEKPRRDAERDTARGGDAGDGKRESDEEKRDRTVRVVANVLAAIGLLAGHVSSAALDQPDLRGWHLLPDRLTVAQLRLPAGTHALALHRNGDRIPLGEVTVRAGTATVLRRRLRADPDVP